MKLVTLDDIDLIELLEKHLKTPQFFVIFSLLKVSYCYVTLIWLLLFSYFTRKMIIRLSPNDVPAAGPIEHSINMNPGINV